MDVWFQQASPSGFGRDPLNPHAPRRVQSVGGRTTADLRENLIKNCPPVPGVYGMLCRKGDLIYVGKSKSLRSRLSSYFSESNADQKGGRIIESTRVIQWETQPSEFAALLREQQLIRRFSPRWNVQGVPARQRPVYLCLGRSPAPYFFVASLPPKDCVAAEGPFHGAGRMNRAVDCLNKVFKLRDCSQKQVFRFAEQLSLFDLEHRPGCLRWELGTCLGPCAGACTRDAYQRQLNAAESFLDGFNDEPLVVTRDQMELAAQQRQYELASRARDTLKSLEYINRRLVALSTARRDYSFIYPSSGFDGTVTWYLIRAGEVADVMAPPRNADETQRCRDRLDIWRGWLSNRLERSGGAYPETLSIVATWFKKNRDELKQTFSPLSAKRRVNQLLKAS